MWFDYYVAAVLFGALFHPQTLAELLADTAKIHRDSLLRQVRMDEISTRIHVCDPTKQSFVKRRG